MPHSGLKALWKSTPLTTTKRVSERTTSAIITVAVIFVTRKLRLVSGLTHKNVISF
jgi:hypothetical protein